MDKLNIYYSKMKQPKTAPLGQTAKSKKFRKILLLIIIILGGLFVTLVLGMYLFGAIYQRQHRGDKVVIGVSFAKETAVDMGVDWQANYSALISDMGIRSFRLMSYWNQIEPRSGEYNFEDLDWQFAQAEKAGAKISLSVGLRQPRWPECHQAQWASDLYDQDYQQWERKLFAYISAVVGRYKSSPSLENWHLENEYYNRSFGDCKNYSAKRLKSEIDLIHNLDAKHPIVLSLANQLGFPVSSSRGDIIATSLYRSSYVEPYGNIKYHMIPTQFYSAKSFFIKLLKGKDVYIHELQLEPWGPKATKDLTIAEQDQYMSAEQIRDNIEYGLQTGMKKMYLWGSEWWYWRKVTLNDPSIWNTVKTEIQKY